MPLAITSRVVSNVVIVDVSGRMCFLEVGLRDHVNELFAKGHREFVLNLSDVPYIDSFGLGQLITIWTSVRNKGGRVILLRPTGHVQKLFEITRLNSVFETSLDEGEALRALRMNVAIPA